MGKMDWFEAWGNIEEALSISEMGGEYDYKPEVFIGPALYCEEQREKIIELMEKYPTRLNIYILPSRPERNISMINGNLLYEDPHGPEETYTEATVVEGADENNLNLIRKRCAQYKTVSKHAFIIDIRNLPIYPQTP